MKVGQQQNPVKHFTAKRKPKSANLRTELLQKSADAQSSLKKASAPTIPLRSRGMPRKMTDTTPLKGIPSRVPTSGFRSPTSLQNQNRPNMSRTPAGRKDGGIKLIEFTEQPLGYAAAKKRKRQQEIEEQQKKAMESKQAVSTSSSTISSASVTTTAAVVTTPTAPTSTTPDYAAGLTSTSVYTTQIKEELSQNKEEVPSKTPVSTSIPNNQNSFTNVQNSINNSIASQPQTPVQSFKNETSIVKEEKPIVKVENIKKETEKVKSEILSSTKSPVKNVSTSAISSNTTTIITSKTIPKQEPLTTNIIMPKSSSSIPIIVNSSTPIKFSSPIIKSSIASASQQTQTNIVSTTPSVSLPKSSGGPVIISQTIIQPAKNVRSQQNQQSATPLNTVVSSPTVVSTLPVSYTQTISNQNQQSQPTQIILTSTPSSVSIPSLTSFAQARPVHTIIQTPVSSHQQQQQQPTKILLKTAPTIPVVVSNTSRTSSTTQNNPPPLISTQQPQSTATILNLQNVNLPNRPVTIQPASQAAQAQHIQAQLQQHHQQQQQHTIVSNTASTEQPKFAQVVMSPGMNTKGKTIILAQKGVILRSIGGDVYQQIPIANASQIGNLGGATIVTAGPQIVKTSTAPQTITQQTTQRTTQQIPALIPTNNLSQSVNVSSLTPVVIASNVQPQAQPQPAAVQTIIGNVSFLSLNF